MRLSNTPDQWGLIARSLHWGMAILILCNFPLGWLAESWERSPLKLDLFVLHKSIGLTVLMLLVLRLGWRIVAGRPDDLSMSGWQRHAARAVHMLLYLLMLVVPLSGLLLNSWADIPLNWFWIYPVPDLAAPDEGLKELGADMHAILVYLMAVLLSVHIAAAFKHHYVERDGVLVRMWRGRMES